MVPEPSMSSLPRPFIGPGTDAEEVYMVSEDEVRGTVAQKEGRD